MHTIEGDAEAAATSDRAQEPPAYLTDSMIGFNFDSTFNCDVGVE
jgi:hypothetical protein